MLNLRMKVRRYCLMITPLHWVYVGLLKYFSYWIEIKPYQKSKKMFFDLTNVNKE